MKSRTFYSAIALLAGLLVFVGAIGFWGLTMQNPRSLISEGGQTTPEAAQFVPRQAPAMVSLLARPDRVWQLRQTLTPSKRRFAARKEWQSLKNSLETATGWDYDIDLRPWLDQEVTVAVTTTDLDRDSENGLQAGYLAVLSCRDVEAAREAMHVLWQKRAATGRNLVFEAVSGVPIIYDREPDDTLYRSMEALRLDDTLLKSLASAIVGERIVLLANDPQVLKQAIATYQAPDVSLAKASNYREAISTLPSNRIGWLYANVPNFITWLGQETTDKLSPLSSKGKRASFLFMSLRAFSSGILGDTAIAAAPGQPFEPSRTMAQTPFSALELLPPETLFATAGTNFAQLLKSTGQNVGGYGVAQRSLQLLLSSLSIPNIASDKVLSPLKGEYALATLANQPTTWLLVTKASEAKDLESIDAFVKEQGINVNQVHTEEGDVTTWTRFSLMRTSPQAPLQLMTQVVGVHALIDGYTVLSTSLLGLEQVLQVDESNSLSRQADFVQLVNNLDEPAGGITYVDWPNLMPTLARRFSWIRAIDQAGQPLTAHLGPIILQDRGSTQSLQEGVVAIKLLENP